MTREEIYDIWAPAHGRWSPWAKPVLFAWMRDDRPAVEPVPPEPDVNWAPAAHENIAIVADLPGADGVWLGLALAQRGYRPVPLYNACPGPTVPAYATVLSPFSHPGTVVNVEPIMRALTQGSPILAGRSLPPDAPPVFLLDANRRTGEGMRVPGAFDNRSVSFPTDFPSANFLLAHGIRETRLVQRSGTDPAADLAHTLRRWQDGGLPLSQQLADTTIVTPLTVAKPSLFRSAWHRLMLLGGLRRNVLGGFGGVIPQPSSAG